MINSEYLSNILSLLIDDIKYGQLLSEQLRLLTESDYEYTGSGVFVGFLKDERIREWRLDVDNLVLNGVLIRSKELQGPGAEAQLHIRDGVISYLEIWSFAGPYPGKDLESYALVQGWEGSNGKQIVKT
jgi:hypothetical protein